MGKYRIEIKRSAVKEIKKFPSKEIKKILLAIESLSRNPRPHHCEKLSDQERYRVRCGSYRIVYTVEDDILIVYVVKIGHRKEVYRKKR